jgi:hypothetical protein
MHHHIGTVKRQIAWLNGQITRFTPDHPRYRPERVEVYERLLWEFQELLTFLETLEPLKPEVKPPSQPPQANGADDLPLASSSRNDLADLPEELLAELSDRTTKGDSDPLIRIIDDRGGVASLDQILIDLYRRHGQLGKRTLIQNKLYRLSKQGLVHTTPGKKGIYTTKQSDSAVS